MKIDFVPRINNFGDAVVRLFDFNRHEAIMLRDAMAEALIQEQKILDMATLDFVQSVNCNLHFRVSETDEGIISAHERTFYCDMSPQGYLRMLDTIQPFCERDTSGYQFLYDLDIPVDLLFSPAGAEVSDLL